MQDIMCLFSSHYSFCGWSFSAFVVSLFIIATATAAAIAAAAVRMKKYQSKRGATMNDGGSSSERVGDYGKKAIPRVWSSTVLPYDEDDGEDNDEDDSLRALVQLFAGS